MLNLDDLQLISQIDSKGILSYVEGIDSQIDEGVKICEKLIIETGGNNDVILNQIVLCGMGGSAVVGDLIRDFLGPDLKVPFLVNRRHTLPFVNSSSCVILASYSGNTEETLSCLRQAEEAQSMIICIASGGRLLDACSRRGIPSVVIPKGYPPRCAIGFGLIILQILLSKLSLASSADSKALKPLIRNQIIKLSPKQPFLQNRSKKIAADLFGRVVIVYGSEGHTGSIAKRWASQLAENGKQLAYSSVIPEMTHNEIVGWNHPKGKLKDLVAVFLRDQEDHPQVSKRIDCTFSILKRRAGLCLEIFSEGLNWSERFWSLVILGDYTSIYLGILNREDPTPVKEIDELKLRADANEIEYED